MSSAPNRQLAELETDFHLGEVVVRPHASTLVVDGVAKRVDYKAMKVLLCLTDDAGCEVAKARIFAQVWDGGAVSDDVLTGAVSTLRRALGDDARCPRFIQTIPRVGYRLIAPVRSLEEKAFEEETPGTAPGESPGTGPRGDYPSRGLPMVLSFLAIVMAAALFGRWTARVEQDPAALTTTAPTIDPAAHDAYLRGRYLAQSAMSSGAVEGGETLERSIEELGRAVALSPGFVDARLALGECRLRAVEWGLDEPEVGLAEVREAGRRALAADPASARGHLLLGVADYLLDWQFDRAETHIRRSLELDPNRVEAHGWLARLLTTLGRFDEALVAVRRVRELDAAAYSRPEVSRVLLLMGQAELAAQEAERQLEVEPESTDLRLQHGFALLELGRTDEAVEIVLDAMAAEGTLSPEQIHGLRARYATEGVPGLYQFFLEAVPADELDPATFDAGQPALRPVSSTRSAMSTAELLIGAGQVERGLDWLELAVKRREPEVVTLRTYSIFDGAREHPRFVALLERVGLL